MRYTGFTDLQRELLLDERLYNYRGLDRAAMEIEVFPDFVIVNTSVLEPDYRETTRSAQFEIPKDTGDLRTYIHTRMREDLGYSR